MIALIDTNVIIDFLQDRAPFGKDAHELMTRIAKGQCIGYVSAKQVADIYYLMHHYLHDDGLSRKQIRLLFELLKVVDTTSSDCMTAIESVMSDYEDAVLAETAKRCSVDCIVTRNADDFSKADIPVYTPVQFLNLPEIIDFTAA